MSEEIHPVCPKNVVQQVNVNAFPSRVAHEPELENVAVSVLGSDGQQLFETVLELLDELERLDD